MSTKFPKWKALLLMVAAVAAIAACLLIFGNFAREPTYQGKSVKEWFEEYTLVGARNGATNWYYYPGRSGREVYDQQTGTRLPDPAWDALRALGSNAVPYLIRRVPAAPWEVMAYQRFFRAMPQALRRILPNPWRRNWQRQFAVEALGDLGTDARAAIPTLLNALKRTDANTRKSVIAALQKLGSGPGSVTPALLELGALGRYDEVVEIASEYGWQGAEVARLLGEGLKSRNILLRRSAIKLLEESGPAAAPALNQILFAMKDPDEQVRYLAARSLESIGKNSPPIVAALRSGLAETNAMVQNVSRRALAKIAPDANPSEEPGQR